jgi:hypothetical protein
MPLSNYALDTFVSQGLSALTEANSREVGPDFPNRAGWFSAFVMNRIFINHVPQERSALAFALIRQADAAIDEHDAGCAVLAQLIHGGKSVPQYFRCLQRFENAIGAAYRAFDFGRRALNRKIFQPNDGSPYQRLNELYNVGRHYDPGTLPAGSLHAVWLSNTGIHSQGAQLTFGELRELVGEVGRIADRISTASRESK